MGGPGNRGRKLRKKMDGISQAMREDYLIRNPKQRKFVDHLKIEEKLKKKK